MGLVSHADLKPNRPSKPAMPKAAAPSRVGQTSAPALAAIAALVGLLLVALAVPRVVAAVHLLQAQDVAERYIAGDQRLTDPEVDAAARDLGVAVDLGPDPSLAVLLCDLRLWQTYRSTDVERRLALATTARAMADRAVRLAPAHALAWIALAEARHVLSPGDVAVASPLSRGLTLGRHDPRRLAKRTDLALRYWQHLDEAGRAAAVPAIRALTQRDTQAMVTLTRDTFALAPVRAALAGDPALARRFDALYLANR